MRKKNFSALSGAWCLVTLFGFANFLASYYAGFKSKSKKYILIGHICLVLKLARVIANMNIKFLSPLLFFLSTAGYFFGIIFAFVTIKAFYKRLSPLDLIDPFILNSEKTRIYSMDNQALERFVEENDYFSEQEKQISNNTDRNNNYRHPGTQEEKHEKSNVYTEQQNIENNDDDSDIDVNITFSLIDEYGNKKKIKTLNIDDDNLEDLFDISDIAKEIITETVVEKEVNYTFEDSENTITFNSKTKKKSESGN
mgnify:CR=1 FL=1